MDPQTREECYEAIRNCIKNRVTRYYEDHPEILDDETRVDLEVAAASEILECVFKVLDGYRLMKIVA